MMHNNPMSQRAMVSRSAELRAAALSEQLPEPSVSGSPQPGAAGGSCNYEILLLVVHSGSVLGKLR